MQCLRSGEDARHLFGLQPLLPPLRGAADAERLGAASAAQGAMGGDRAQAGRARQSGYFRAGAGRTTLMQYAIGPRFARLMPTKHRPQRTDEMLAALVACDAGCTTRSSMDAAVGVPRPDGATGRALASRMGLIEPIHAGLSLYKPSGLGETVLRLLDAEVA